MNTIKMLLKDESEVVLVEFAVPMHATVKCDTDEEAMAIWKRLTKENLSSVMVTLNGEVIMQFSDALLSGVQCVMNPDGTITEHIYMQGNKSPMNEEEIEYINAARVLLGEV